MAKLIVIEGTDCSGKETQSNLLIEKLNSEGIKINKMSFPNYDSPTGKIVGGPYLGKSYICEGYFEEKAPNVDPKVASLYYAADRKYNAPKIEALLNENINVLLDRYVESNMGHQGSKLKTKEGRIRTYEWLRKLEYEFLNLPRPDLIIFLYMPYKCALELKKNRKEIPDQLEMSEEHLINAEQAYLELAELYGFSKINCFENNKIKTVEEIHQEVHLLVKKII